MTADTGTVSTSSAAARVIDAVAVEPEARVTGASVTVTRTGYTGDLGYEVWCASPDALMVWDALWEAFDGQGRSLVRRGYFFDTYRNWVLLRHWLSELRVAVTHVFVSPELRPLLLEYGRQNPEFTRFVARAEQVLQAHPTHTDHFHLRIACPADQSARCVDGGAEPRSIYSTDPIVIAKHPRHAPQELR